MQLLALNASETTGRKAHSKAPDKHLDLWTTALGKKGGMEMEIKGLERGKGEKKGKKERKAKEGNKHGGEALPHSYFSNSSPMCTCILCILVNAVLRQPA